MQCPSEQVPGPARQRHGKAALPRNACKHGRQHHAGSGPPARRASQRRTPAAPSQRPTGSRPKRRSSRTPSPERCRPCRRRHCPGSRSLRDESRGSSKDGGGAVSNWTCGTSSSWRITAVRKGASAAQAVAPALTDSRRLVWKKQRRPAFIRCLPAAGLAKRQGLQRRRSGSLARRASKTGGVAVRHDRVAGNTGSEVTNRRRSSLPQARTLSVLLRPRWRYICARGPNRQTHQHHTNHSRGLANKHGLALSQSIARKVHGLWSSGVA